MIMSLSIFGMPTILVTKPGLKKRLFQPVTGLVRMSGWAVVIGSRRTGRPNAMQSSACICEECSAMREERYACMGDERALYAAY